MRTDLLALGADDLASISNRGNVNRATRELDNGKVTGELTESDGRIEVKWSDGPTTVIPADAIVDDATCTCPATTVCRHIVRCVIAYQRSVEASGDLGPTPSEPWNPGSITDDQLAQLVRGSNLTRWRSVYSEAPGLVVELVRSSKPTARFHRLGHTIRFLVPNDARYTRCDCDEPTPCRHVPLAIWAFRELAPERTNGVIETIGSEAPVDAATLAPLLDTLERLVEIGLSDTPKARIDRIRSVERTLRDCGLLWPAEALHDLLRQWQHYHDHDARFSAVRVANLVSELVTRADALVAPDLPVPRLFVRGEHRSGSAKLGQTKLVGLGTTAITRHGSVELVAILQDTKSGKVMSIVETFPDPPDDSPRHTRSFSELARQPVFDSRDFGTLGRSQLVVKSVRLNPNHTLSIRRAATSAYGQDFEWDNLLAPLFCETIGELRARIEAQPPASLRARRFGEDFVVMPVAECENARFDPRTQTLRADISDVTGEPVELVHPYTDRGRSGLERSLQWLTGSASLRYVAAQGRMTPTGLVLAPTSLIFEEGSRRHMVQPWIDDMDDHLEKSTVSLSEVAVATNALDQHRLNLAEWLGKTLVTGLDERGLQEAADLLASAQSLGFTSHAAPLEVLCETRNSESFFELLVAANLSRELG